MDIRTGCDSGKPVRLIQKESFEELLEELLAALARGVLFGVLQLDNVDKYPQHKFPCLSPPTHLPSNTAVEPTSKDWKPRVGNAVLTVDGTYSPLWSTKTPTPTLVISSWMLL